MLKVILKIEKCKAFLCLKRESNEICLDEKHLSKIKKLIKTIYETGLDDLKSTLSTQLGAVKVTVRTGREFLIEIEQGQSIVTIAVRDLVSLISKLETLKEQTCPLSIKRGLIGLGIATPIIMIVEKLAGTSLLSAAVGCVEGVIASLILLGILKCYYRRRRVIVEVEIAEE